ncbi:MAG: hypothetical protein ACXW4H_00305 [Candidatus Limnocylindrales bacterium]
MPSETIRTAIDRALEAYGGLTELGEAIDDEWSYVNDLSDAWRARLVAVTDERGDELVVDAVSVAIDRGIEEVGLIADPHRAIDWLSTFPQIVLIALGETP